MTARSVDAHIHGARRNAHRDDVEMSQRSSFGENTFKDSQVGELISIAERSLFAELDRETFVEAVRHEAADRLEVLGAPGFLDRVKGEGRSGRECLAVELRVALSNRRGELVGLRLSTFRRGSIVGDDLSLAVDRERDQREDDDEVEEGEVTAAA